MRLDIEDLDIILKERRLQLYGHVECSNGAVKTACDIQVDRKRGPGRPKMTWKQLTKRDCYFVLSCAIQYEQSHQKHLFMFLYFILKDITWKDVFCLAFYFQ